MPQKLIEVDLKQSPYKNEMVHNRWHPEIPMACWVKPGDDFVLETYDWTGGFIKNDDCADDVRDIELFGREFAKIANRIVARSKLSLLELTSEFRVQTVEDALERHDHNVTAAAKELRITRKTFYRIAGTNLRRIRRS